MKAQKYDQSYGWSQLVDLYVDSAHQQSLPIERRFNDKLRTRYLLSIDILGEEIEPM